MSWGRLRIAMACATPDYTHTLGETNEDLDLVLSLDGVVADLTGAVVTLRLRHRKTRDETTFAMVATDASAGEFRYPWASGEPAAAGDYDARAEIALVGGAVAYSPTNSWLLFRFL
jgi:hypothetical protein